MIFFFIYKKVKILGFIFLYYYYFLFLYVKDFLVVHKAYIIESLYVYKQKSCLVNYIQSILPRRKKQWEMEEKQTVSVTKNNLSISKLHYLKFIDYNFIDIFSILVVANCLTQ